MEVGSLPAVLGEGLERHDFETSSNSSVTSGHYSTVESAALSNPQSHTRASPTSVHHQPLHSSSPTGPSDIRDSNLAEQPPSPTLLTPLLPATATFNIDTNTRTNEVVASSSLSQHDAYSSYGVTIRGSVHKTLRARSYSLVETDGASSFFARPAVRQRRNAPVATDRNIIHSIVQLILKPIMQPLRFCLGARDSPQPHTAQIGDWGDDDQEYLDSSERDHFGDITSSQPEGADMITGIVTSSQEETNNVGQDTLQVVKELEARVARLEAALVQERKRREALAALHGAEIRRLFKGFRESLAGVDS